MGFVISTFSKHGRNFMPRVKSVLKSLFYFIYFCRILSNGVECQNLLRFFVKKRYF